MKGSNILKRVRTRNVVWYAVFILALLCIRSSVFASYHVPTGSMNPTILEGDFFFANKLAYRLKLPFSKTTLAEWQSPERGDIVVFRLPGDEREMYTKRVIAVPGDEIEIVDKQIRVNGVAVERNVVERKGGTLVCEEDLFGVRYRVYYAARRTHFDDMRSIIVPEHHLFVMGDNRDNSYDSRAWGLVPFENVEGEMVVRWLSIDPATHLPRFGRIGLIN